MEIPRLAAEHPTLTANVNAVIELLSEWPVEIEPAPDAAAWMHHVDFAERTQALADHLRGAVLLAESGFLWSALALMRTALEHHLLDRLILLADRYEEIVAPPDPSQTDEWVKEFEAKDAPWTREVASITPVRQGRALKLVRFGHNVVDVDGNVNERISPYWVAVEHYDAFVGHPDLQIATARPFSSLEELEQWARRNQALYSAFLKWSSICWNLQLSGLVMPATLTQLQVHYSFLSAFTHAVNTRRRAIGHTRPGGPSAEHVVGELVLLYAAAIGISEIKAWETYIDGRRSLLAPLSPRITQQVARTEAVVGYVWFLVGGPQPFDLYQEANRRADPLLRSGARSAVTPEMIPEDEVRYYADPVERLSRMHVGEREGTTGFSFAPAWRVLHW